MLRRAGAVLGMLFLAHAAAAQFVQQGSVLVGTGIACNPCGFGTAEQGTSVAISADGNTAIVGGPGDNNQDGAAWVFTRSGGLWSQQGNKLVGADAVGAAEQGTSVAISGDGNTAVIGGPTDNGGEFGGIGAVWVFTRRGGLWSQQGDKLVATGAIGGAELGKSVAISAEGTTIIVGGPGDNSYAGAAWVFTESAGVWSQRAGKLVGTGAIGAANQGHSVAISTDGNTAIVGGYNDNSGVGAAWVFTRNEEVWAQQGTKVVGTGAVGDAGQGTSVAVSGDGNTAIVGGYYDDSGTGAAWVFTRTRGVWAQQGDRLVGTNAQGVAEQGTSVSISGDGNTSIVGGPRDGHGNSQNGAVWVYTRSGGVWSQQGNKLLGGYAYAHQGTSVAISGEGNTAIVGGPGDSSNNGDACVFFDATHCSAPSITVQPQNQSITSGQTATLSVTATGRTPLSYRWYQGYAGDTSKPVGANASTFTTPPLDSTTSYWVWVFNACGTADSATATISVERRVRRHLQRAI